MPTNLWAEKLTWQLLTSFCNYTLNPEKKFLNSNYLMSGFPGSSNYWTWFTKNFLPYQGRIKDFLKKYFLILSNKYHPSNHLILFILHYICITSIYVLFTLLSVCSLVLLSCCALNKSMPQNGTTFSLLSLTHFSRTILSLTSRSMRLSVYNY